MNCDTTNPHTPSGISFNPIWFLIFYKYPLSPLVNFLHKIQKPRGLLGENVYENQADNGYGNHRINNAKKD